MSANSTSEHSVTLPAPDTRIAGRGGRAGLLLDARGGEAARRHAVGRDIGDGLAQWKLGCALGWLDIKLRYRAPPWGRSG